MIHQKMISDAEIEDQWAALKNAIKDILSGNNRDQPYIKETQACTNLVQSGRSDEIFNGFCNILTKHYKETNQEFK